MQCHVDMCCVLHGVDLAAGGGGSGGGGSGDRVRACVRVCVCYAGDCVAV